MYGLNLGISENMKDVRIKVLPELTAENGKNKYYI